MRLWKHLSSLLGLFPITPSLTVITDLKVEKATEGWRMLLSKSILRFSNIQPGRKSKKGEHTRITALIDKPLERIKSVLKTKGQTLDRWRDLCSGEVFRQILLDRNILTIDEKLIEAVAGESEALELLSKHDSNLPITEATIVKTTRKVETLRIVLKTRNNVILVTKKIMKAARRHLDLQTVREAWWQRDLPKRVRASEILFENDNVEAFKHMVEKLSQDKNDYDLAELLGFSTEHKASK
ncbi:uncharacterized protein EURHEDRAFT_402541 [Aspergillus ruber CBS 135680]|uniref:Uncharacterized protein n=1 Tax=Aspergillus ruber (strain CBS 135680) TaxID=1388766 RepID=A0A017SEY7_ASPRC|nr:uncharacterized protein EURHEDRAFT_402541 [Aspergillus ruber CBS 135680]EYE95346.1 hypothetical protein EURHEDRAFT_402541 [Aspergillus ruber CBS 135680]